MSEDRLNKNSQGQNEDDDIIQFFCRHLVAICITFQNIDAKNQPINEVKFDAFPGVIINIRDFYYFLTAGHVLQTWENAFREKKVNILDSVLADTFGPDMRSPQPIPFDFLNERIFYINDDEKGLDFGLIVLHSHYVRLLEKNGIEIIFEENWIYQDRKEFNFYAMLGLPAEFISIIQTGSDKNLQTIGSVSPTLIPMRKMATQPENIKKTKFPRFIGKLSSNLPVKSIVGMSGGPIFGFNIGPPMRYWIVAIQSSWLEERRITFGCPLPVLAKLLTEWTDRFLNEKI